MATPAIAAIAVIAGGCGILPSAPSTALTTGGASPAPGPLTLVTIQPGQATSAPPATPSAVAPDLAGRLDCGGGMPVGRLNDGTARVAGAGV